MADMPIRAESDHSLPPSSSETRAPSPERETKGHAKRSITPHRHIFSDFSEAHRKITRSAAGDPFHSPFDGNESSEDVSSRNMPRRSPPFALQDTEDFPISLQQTAASGFSQVYPEVRERGRLTVRNLTPIKIITDSPPSTGHSVGPSTTSDLGPVKRRILPTRYATEITVGQMARQSATKDTASTSHGQDGPGHGTGLQIPKTRKSKDKDGSSDGCQHNDAITECDGSDTGGTEVSPLFLLSPLHSFLENNADMLLVLLLRYQDGTDRCPTSPRRSNSRGSPGPARWRK